MVTIKTVAQKAKVSTGTVSNVLSGNRPVSEEVRKRVMQAIDELGYKPNLLASSLVTGRSNTIGAVIPGFFFGMGPALPQRGKRASPFLGPTSSSASLTLRMTISGDCFGL